MSSRSFAITDRCWAAAIKKLKLTRASAKKPENSGRAHDAYLQEILKLKLDDLELIISEHQMGLVKRHPSTIKIIEDEIARRILIEEGTNDI